MAQTTKVVNDYAMNSDKPLYVATSSIDTITSGTITALNAAEVTNNNPTANTYLTIDATGKGTVTFQVTGTWSVATGGLYVQATLDDTNWITLSNPYSMLKISNMDYDGYLHSGKTGIWQLETVGYSAVRIIAVGTTWTGTATLTLSSSSNVRTYMSNIAGLPYTKNISSNGDGTGTISMIGDYSAANTDFYYQVPAGMKYYVHGVVITVSDNAQFAQTGYGGLAALTNGVTFLVSNNGVETPILSGQYFKTNKDWFAMTPHTLLTTFQGTNDTLIIDFEVSSDFGLPLLMNGDDQSKFIVRLHDNLTGLVDHRCMLRGRLV